MRIAAARKLAAHWQEALGLGNWSIRARWAKKSDKCEECFGCCTWFTEEASAELILNRRRADEETIIHELLHVRLEGHLPEPTGYDALYEQALNHLAKLLANGAECANRKHTS